MVSSIGGFGFGLSQILFAIVIIQCARGGKKASAEVWDGATPTGLEWTCPRRRRITASPRRPRSNERGSSSGHGKSGASATARLGLAPWRWRFISASSRCLFFAVTTDGSRDQQNAPTAS
jgi:heme/copper-type cytochrome/quinol oxidase subunit 1